MGISPHPFFGDFLKEGPISSLLRCAHILWASQDQLSFLSENAPATTAHQPTRGTGGGERGCIGTTEHIVHFLFFNHALKANSNEGIDLLFFEKRKFRGFLSANTPSNALSFKSFVVFMFIPPACQMTSASKAFVFRAPSLKNGAVLNSSSPTPLFKTIMCSFRSLILFHFTFLKFLKKMYYFFFLVDFSNLNFCSFPQYARVEIPFFFLIGSLLRFTSNIHLLFGTNIFIPLLLLFRTFFQKAAAAHFLNEHLKISEEGRYPFQRFLSFPNILKPQKTW